MTLLAVTNESLLAEVEALVPLIRENAAKGEHERRMPPETLEALESAGVFKMPIPKRYGGLQTDLPTEFEVVRTIGHGDGSAAWFVAAGYAIAWWAAHFPDEVQDEIFSDPDVRVAGIISPRGTLTPARGGFLLNGTWPFNTGCLHATWNVILTLRPNADGVPEPYVALIPMSAFNIVDDWYVSGMRATGSNTVVAEDVFVPEERVLPAMPFMTGGEGAQLSKLNAKEAVYRCDSFPFECSAIVATPIGIAEGMLETFLEHMPKRTFAFDRPIPLAESPITHLHVSEAIMKIDLVRMLSRGRTAMIHEYGERGESMPPEERLRTRVDVAYTMEQSRQACEIIQRISGASSAYSHVPIQRHFRDIQVIANHAFFNYDSTMTLFGRVAVGLEPDSPFV